MTTTGNNSGTNGGYISIPINTGNANGGNIQWLPSVPGQTYTIVVGGGGGGGGGAQVSSPLFDIDLAVPVDEKEKKSDGCSCKKCKEFFEYAEPNQEDGTLICWACRHGY